MKYIEKLLNGAEVKWMPLGEVFETRNGYTPSKANNDFWTNGDIPWFRMEDIRDSGRLLNDSIQHITPQAIKGKGLFRANSIIMATTATIGEHVLLLVDALANQQFTNFQIRKSLSERISPMFAFYYFFVLGEWCKSNVNTSSFPSVDMARLMKQLFPIPPLAVQEEIVRILDKFTTLEAELDCRKRQYEYYRNQLLSLDVINSKGNLNNVEVMTLGEIAEYSRTRVSSSDVCENTFVGVDNLLQNKRGKTISTHVPTEGNLTAYQVGDVLIGNIRPYLKKIWQADNNGGASGDVLVIHITNEKIMPRYLYQVLADDMFFTYNMQYAKGAKMPRGNKQKIMEYKIPIPSLAEQQRIVSILDKFEALTTSISEGLPKEIALRRKQYEYYRNQLLSFA